MPVYYVNTTVGGMIMGIKEMIERCIGRMRSGACATCDNRGFCPAGRWQQAFAPPAAPPKERKASPLLALLGQVASALSAPQARCFRKEVEDAIEPLLATGGATIDQVARQLGMSRQTLYRRLKAEGVTFEEILEAKRRSIAIRLLGIERASVKSATYRLGFSDPAAFSRAFKRWTGISPSDFRLA
jgi:AraC-like DNA-binding protein